MEYYLMAYLLPQGNLYQNFLINGGFDIFQRGTSAANTMRADRWSADNNQNASWSRQAFTANGVHPGNAQFVLRAAGDNGTSMRVVTAQGVENINTVKMIGKTVTFSGFIRVSAATTSSAGSLGALTVNLGYTTATADSAFATTNYLVGGASAVTYTQGSLPTVWAFFTTTMAIPTTATNVAVRIQFANSVVAATTDYYELSNCMLNIGTQAAPFQLAGGSIGGETALCQRYYERMGDGMVGAWLASTACTIAGRYAVPKRITPVVTLLTTTPTVLQIAVGSKTGAGSTISTTNASDQRGLCIDINGFSGATAQNGAAVTTGDLIGADAEL
jgi:hypothetical protein